MNDIIYSLKPIVPFIIYFLVLFFILFFVIFFFEKRGVDDYSAGYFGFFMNIRKRQVLALSILLTYYFVVIESIFINTFSIFNLVIFLVLEILANVVALNIKYLFFSSIFSIAMYYGLYFQKIFIGYLNDIDRVWYLQICAVLLGLFMVFITTFCVFRNASSISLKEKTA